MLLISKFSQLCNYFAKRFEMEVQSKPTYWNFLTNTIFEQKLYTLFDRDSKKKNLDLETNSQFHQR